MVRSISFRIAAKNIFLTYPQCSLPKEECLDLLLSLGYSIKPFYIRVCSELHQEDGSPHLHCLLQFQQKFQTQNKRFFDLLSSTRSTHFHHPNIQAAKSALAVQSYISKAGDYVDHGDFQPAGGRSKSNIEGAKNASAVQSYISKAGDYVDHGDFQPTGGRTKTKADILREAFAANNKELALSIIREGDPKTYLVKYDKICSKLDRIFQKQPEPYRSPFPCFDQVPDGILEWARNNIKEEAQRPYSPVSIIIEGPTRTGKTVWARSLGPHNYYAGDMDLANHTDDVFFNVIDNVDPKNLKLWRELIGSKRDWILNCRYAKPRRIKGGIPAIILCNPGPGSSYRDYLELGKNKSLKEWTSMNAEFFFIQQPFFSTPSRFPASSLNTS